MKTGNFSWLLLALFVFLIGVPIADDLGALGEPIARALSFSCLLGVGVFSLRGSGRVFSIAMFFAIAGIIMNFAAMRTSSDSLIIASFPLGWPRWERLLAASG